MLPLSIRSLLVVSGLILLVGCSSYQTSPPATSEPVVGAPRSSRGNPPFYEVFGKRYYVLKTSDGYSERGIASWYGPKFHGRQTSNGETYDMHAMTAAHKTLPIPTWVEVTNLVNRKRVIVRINDRGPFVDERIIDLSYRAAQDLGMIRAGTARVSVRVLGAPNASASQVARPIQAASRSPVQAATPDEPPVRGFSVISDAAAATPGLDDTPFRPLYLQVGAFSDYDNAAQLVARLKRGGHVNSFVVSSDEGSRRLHRVRIGPLEDADHFDQVRFGVRAMGLNETRMIVEN